MLINARPRIVSNGFETFVPAHRAESLHQSLVEMTSNNVNAWSIFRPVASSTDGWDQHLDDFSNENFPLHTLYAGYYQDTTSINQGLSINLPKASPYAGVHQDQCQPYKRPSTSHPTYQEPVSEMNCFENQSPMLGNDYSQWNLGRRNGSFAEFLNTRNGLRNFSYHTSNEANFTPFPSVTNLAQQQLSYQDTSGVSDILKDERTSPSTVYSNYSSSSTSVNPGSLVCPVPNVQDTHMKDTWWPEDQHQGVHGTFTSHDGLPKNYNQQQRQEWNESWNIADGSTSNWTSRSAAPITVSPKALTLNVASTPLSSSGSSQGVALSLSDSSTGLGSGDDNSDFSGPETLWVVERHAPRRPRHILPNSSPTSQRRVPVVPSNDFAASRTTKRRLTKAKSGGHIDNRSDQPSCATLSKNKALPSQEIELVPQKLSAPKRIEPKPVDSSVQQPCTTESPQAAQSAATIQAMHHRDAKDDFLVRSKLAGMSYKDIRRQGKFTEAESTLRGRFRTLTKHKTARVRKPEWDDNDIRLLRKAVRKLASGSDPTKSRVPWKQVAEYIANNGGSYHFGNATCRKRWDELQRQSES